VVAPIEAADTVDDGGIRIDAPVEHAEFGTGTVMGIEDDRLTVFFPEHGYKVLARAAFENGILELGEAA
jgi:ATP-dependent DNA helicase RecQ